MDNIFQNKKLNSKKLLNYGFKKGKDSFSYTTKLLEGDFRLDVEIKAPNIVETKIVELETNEIYTLHLTDSQGTFIGKIREEYQNKLTDIVQKCFESNIFKTEYAVKIIEYIRKKYNNEIEFLWEKFAGNAVARRTDNNKWYLALLTVQKNKLGINSNELIEIVDLRADKKEVPELIKKDNIYPGYHMNKQNWITIILDGSMDIEEIFEYIDKSYILAAKKS